MKTITEEAFNTRLGQKLMIVRVKERMTLQQVGVYLGVTGQQIHRYETGESRLPPEKLHRYCQVFEVSPAYFFEDIEATGGIDRVLMGLAAEIYALPCDIRQTFYTLGKQVNAHVQGQSPTPPDPDNDDQPPKKTAA